MGHERQFNPDGQLWRVNKERLATFGGGRALLMQLAHPMVAQAISDAKFLENKPQERLLNTLGSGLSLIFSTPEEAQQISQRINKTHSYIKGVLQEDAGLHSKGDPYSAQDKEALTWVASTIMDSSIMGYETLVGDLEKDEKDLYVNEAKELFAMLNVPESIFPRDYLDLKVYMQDMINVGEVKVTQNAKRLAPYAMLQHAEPTKTLGYPVFRFTIYLLPEEIRKQYGFKMSPLEKKIIEKTAAGIKKSVPYISPKIRYSALSRN